VTKKGPSGYFRTHDGIKLTMEELRERAFPQECWAGVICSGLRAGAAGAQSESDEMRGQFGDASQEGCSSVGGPCMKSSSNILLIKSHGSIELVGPNPRAASGFTHVYSVWLKCQIRERLAVSSMDIGTGFQIFQRHARRFLST
jgi:hypothetical protein